MIFSRQIPKLLLTGFLVITASAQAQSYLNFSNRDIGAGVDARVTLFELGGSPPGPGFTAQLWWGPLGSPKDSFQPLFPTTTFRTSSPAAAYYVEPVIVEVPALAFEDISMVMRVYAGSSWDSATCRGESDVFRTITGTQELPYGLLGLSHFSIPCVPEPSTFVLLLMGGFAFIFRLIKQPSP